MSSDRHSHVLSFDGEGSIDGSIDSTAPAPRRDGCTYGGRYIAFVQFFTALSCSIGLAVLSHRRYVQQGLYVLPFAQVLLGLMAGIVVVAMVITLTHLLSRGKDGRDAGRVFHQCCVGSVSALWVCGLLAAEAMIGLDKVAGYFHLQLWLLPLWTLHGGLLRSRGAVAALWLPLFCYIGGTWQASGVLAYYTAKKPLKWH